MPNWCDNELYIVGEEEQILEFLEFAKSDDYYQNGEICLLDFNKFVPQPSDDELEKMYDNTKGSMPGWYKWRVDNWETKWNSYDPRVEEVWNDTYCVRFNTAWSPPIPVVLAMSEKFPRLEFDLRYFECGVGFNGMFVCKNGTVIREGQGEYFGNRGG